MLTLHYGNDTKFAKGTAIDAAISKKPHAHQNQSFLRFC